MKKLIGIVLVLASSVAFGASSQDASTNMEILRGKMEADKKLLVAQAMNLSDAQGKAFWPIYDAHQAELEKLNVRIGQLITRYAGAYNAGKGDLTSDQAKKLTDESFAIDADELKLRKATAAKVGKALSAAHAARYVQLENKIRAIIRYELAAQIPLAGVGETK
jgi:hypothetical protein